MSSKNYARELAVKRCEDLIDALAGYAAMLPRPEVVRVLRETEFRAEYCANVLRAERNISTNKEIQ